MAIGSNQHKFGRLRWNFGGVTQISDVACHVGGGTRKVCQAAATLAWRPPPWLAYVALGVVGCLPGGSISLFFLLFFAFK